jgi:hypothetical protein
MLNQFKALYGDTVFKNIGFDEVFRFLESLTQGLARSTRRLRYAQLKSLFNFVINRCDLDMKNPCNTSLLSKTFRTPKQSPRKIFDKEAIDEIIYNTKNLRDRHQDLKTTQAYLGKVSETEAIRWMDIIHGK